jgi:hypothetical protein
MLSNRRAGVPEKLLSTGLSAGTVADGVWAADVGSELRSLMR